jgi:sirohydrochlorin cobaltochelatase
MAHAAMKPFGTRDRIMLTRSMTSDVAHHANESECGWLLVGHGTREQCGIDEFLATGRLVSQAATGHLIEPAFLEFARPTIAEALETLVARGARRVVVVPLLLFSAGHAQRDIPLAVRAAAAAHPEVSIAEAAHLGCHRLLLELSARRYEEAIAAAPPAAESETALVLVGRGSHDPAATAEMQRFLELRRAMTPVGHAIKCFVSMAEPRLEAVLDGFAECGARRVIVQPHLLFDGVLVDRIGSAVAGHAQHHPRTHWQVAAHLGCDSLLADAIAARAGEAVDFHKILGPTVA